MAKKSAAQIFTELLDMEPKERRNIMIDRCITNPSGYRSLFFPMDPTAYGDVTLQRLIRMDDEAILDALAGAVIYRPAWFAEVFETKTDEDWQALARADQRIEAIKLYRAIHRGAGLKEAKDAVEAYMADPLDQLRATDEVLKWYVGPPARRPGLFD